MDRPLDSRLREVRDLLRDLLQESGGESEEQSHWELPVLPPPDPDGRLSSTDLLTWWFRGGRPGRGHWDDYFRLVDGAKPAPDDSGALALKTSRATAGRSSSAAPAAARDGWPPIAGLFPEPEEQLAEEHAQAAVDCLYDFIHALGRRDVDGAMAMVAEDYHAMELGQEVDHLKLRHGLESYLDSLRRCELDVSLAEAPEPLSHPYGILISVCIQFDAHDPRDGSKSGRVERRVAVLKCNDRGAWKIHALSRVDA